MNSYPKSLQVPSDGIVLRTRRMVLRATVEADIFQLHQKIFGVPEVMKWVFAGSALSCASSESFVRANFNFEAAPTGLCVLADKVSGEVIGFAGLSPSQVLSADDLEFGFVLAKEVWGKGLATEIGLAQIAFGLEHLGRTRLLALASPKNVASIKTLKKLGMRYHSDVRPPGRSARQVYFTGFDNPLPSPGR
jgi:ribosomal-protein-alanine N-acetyltransferase